MREVVRSGAMRASTPSSGGQTLQEVLAANFKRTFASASAKKIVRNSKKFFPRLDLKQWCTASTKSKSTVQKDKYSTAGYFRAIQYWNGITEALSSCAKQYEGVPKDAL